MGILIQHPAINQAQKGSSLISMPVGDSKFLMNVDYDPNSLQMTVTMKGGSQYIYHMVFPNVMNDFQEARDKSEFYSQQIRSKYQATRIVSKTTGKKRKT